MLLVLLVILLFLYLEILYKRQLHYFVTPVRWTIISITSAIYNVPYFKYGGFQQEKNLYSS